MMRLTDRPVVLKRSRGARLRELKAPGPMLAASLVRLARRCGYKGCRCARGEKHVSFYLTLKQKGTTQTLYVPLERLTEVRAWVKEYRRVRGLIREVSNLSWKLLKAETQIRKARKARRR
jgi:hypothetical protein